MTAEERAHETWVRIAANNGFHYQEYMEQCITEAIAEAVRAERERCAQVAETWRKRWESYERTAAAQVIADAIRQEPDVR